MRTKIPAHWDRNDPVLEIAISNYTMAIDQAYDYDSIEQAIESYVQNASDTAKEKRMSSADIMAAGDAVCVLYRYNFQPTDEA